MKNFAPRKKKASPVMDALLSIAQSLVERCVMQEKQDVPKYETRRLYWLRCAITCLDNARMQIRPPKKEQEDFR